MVKNRSESKMEEEKIVINKNGQDIECEVLFTFDSEDTGKAYIGKKTGFCSASIFFRRVLFTVGTIC